MRVSVCSLHQVTNPFQLPGKVEPLDINSVDDLKTDLNLLGSIPSNKLLALEVLWTPQDDNDFFTRDQLIEDYPLMNSI